MLASLRASAAALLRGTRSPWLYLLLLVGVFIWSAAYQVKREYTVDPADLANHPYISGFNDVERSTTDPPFDYRWSKSDPTIYLPGIGNQPVVVSITTIGARPTDEPPLLNVQARGQTFQLQTRPEEHTDSFVVERGDSLDGDFRLSISVPTFTPPGDPRTLGVIIRRVTITPASYGLRPPVIPPVGTLLSMLFGLVGAYFVTLVCTRRVRLSLSLTAVLAILFTALVVISPPDMSFVAGQLPSLLGWGLLCAAVGRAVLDWGCGSNSPAADFAAGCGSAAFSLAFMVRFGGLTYAQFLTSDLFLHIHNTQDILRGTWVFTEPLPDGTIVPYPPAYYVLVGAASLLVGRSDEMLGLLLKWSASLLDASTCLALAWAGWRLWPGRAGGVAALAYAGAPAVFDLLSAGNYTNLFAQSVLNLTLLGGVVYLTHSRLGNRPLSLVALGAGFSLTMLGHYGMMLGTLTIVAFFTMFTVAHQLRGIPVQRAWGIILASVGALAFSFAAYYRHMLDVMWAQWSGALSRVVGPAQETTPSGARPGFSEMLGRLPGRLVDLVGVILLSSGLFGAALVQKVAPSARALVFSWLLAAAAFMVLDAAIGDVLRWYYLGAAPLALLAGRFLGVVSARGGHARLFVALAVLAMVLQMMTFWVTLIFIRYH